ncbi:unnamed protein product, partial [Amoebophrya sp. A25]
SSDSAAGASSSKRVREAQNRLDQHAAQRPADPERPVSAESIFSKLREVLKERWGFTRNPARDFLSGLGNDLEEQKLVANEAAAEANDPARVCDAMHQLWEMFGEENKDDNYEEKDITEQEKDITKRVYHTMQMPEIAAREAAKADIPSKWETYVHDVVGSFDTASDVSRQQDEATVGVNWKKLRLDLDISESSVGEGPTRTTTTTSVLICGEIFKKHEEEGMKCLDYDTKWQALMEQELGIMDSKYSTKGALRTTRRSSGTILTVRAAKEQLMKALLDLAELQLGNIFLGLDPYKKYSESEALGEGISHIGFATSSHGIQDFAKRFRQHLFRYGVDGFDLLSGTRPLHDGTALLPCGELTFELRTREQREARRPLVFFERNLWGEQEMSLQQKKQFSATGHVQNSKACSDDLSGMYHLTRDEEVAQVVGSELSLAQFQEATHLKEEHPAVEVIE